MDLSVCSRGQHSSNLAFAIQEHQLSRGMWAGGHQPGLDWLGCGNLEEDMDGSAGGSSQVKFGKHWRKGSLEQQQGAVGVSCSSVPIPRGIWWALSSSDTALHPRDAAGGLQPPPKHLFPPLSRDQSRELALCSQQGGFEQDNPLVRHQTAACEPSAPLTPTPREKLLDWKKDINLKSTQQSNCRVFPPPARASEGKLITMTHRSPDLVFHFKICK